MSKTSILTTTLAIALLAPFSGVLADGQNTLASTMDVYVFPTAGQDSSQQSIDEVECYNWAVQNTGNDPFELTKQIARAAVEAEQTKQEAHQSSSAKGALGGAAAGALIGELASDDPGKGATYGAAGGLIASRLQARRKQDEATQQADEVVVQTEQETAHLLEAFNKAFSVCLEGNNYLVKY